MLMTNLKMDPPKKGNVKKTYLGVKFSSKAASCKLEFKPVTSLVLIPKLLMGGGGKKKKKITLLVVAVLHLQHWSPSCI